MVQMWILEQVSRCLYNRYIETKQQISNKFWPLSFYFHAIQEKEIIYDNENGFIKKHKKKKGIEGKTKCCFLFELSSKINYFDRWRWKYSKEKEENMNNVMLVHTLSIFNRFIG